MRRPFYGWYIVGVVFSTGLARAGFTGVLFGIFLKPMAEEFGWSRAEITGAVTLGTIGAAMAGMLSGWAVDRFGPRVLFPATGLVMAAAYLGLAWVQTLLAFYGAYITGRVITQSMLGESMLSSVVSRWFVRKRGLAISLAAMGTPIAGLVLAVALQAIMNVAGWREAWSTLGVIALLLLVGPPLLLLRPTPEAIGLLPDGDARRPSGGAVGRGQGARAGVAEGSQHEERSYRLADARRTPAFWLLMGASSVGALGATGVNFHMVPHFTDVGIAPLAAASALGMFGLVEALSMPLWGMLSGRIHVQKALLMATGVQATGVLMIITARVDLTAYASAMVYAVGLGGYLTLLSVAWAKYFGRRHLAAIRGWEITFKMSANAFGPLMAALIFGATGSYTVAFGVSFGIVIVVMTLVSLAREPGPARAPARGAGGR